MPALITHRLFGEESIERLPEGIITNEDERAAFLLANQGPDPFFFRFRTPNMGTCMELARVMHRSRMSRQFAALREGVSRLQPSDSGVGRAWTLGMLSHYVLDRNAHPFVYAQQWGIQEADPDLTGAGSQVHAVVESDLDLLMLQLKRNGATIAEFPPVGEVSSNPRIDKVAGALVSFMAKSVYGVDVAANEYGGAVADMQLVYRLIEPAGSMRSDMLGRLESLVSDYSLLQSLAHRVTTETPSACGNLEHKPWRNPFSETDSAEAFPDVFDRALDDYAQAACRFIETGDMGAVTEHVNYSGRPLDANEEFDREE